MPILASPPHITSAYTKVDLNRCKEIEHEEEGARYAWRCPGFKSIPLFIQSDDERIDVDARMQDNDQIDSLTFDEFPTTVEWRLENGIPFAIIYRLTVANPDSPKTSRLLVERIGKEKIMGCRIASIPGAWPKANEIARHIADTIPSGTAACINYKD